MLARILLPFAAALTAGAAASQTLVVDINNGPGTAYTSLIDAAANAPDGAVLEVRPGFYFGAVLVDAKSLSIFCDPGAVIATLSPVSNMARKARLKAAEDPVVTAMRSGETETP